MHVTKAIIAATFAGALVGCSQSAPQAAAPCPQQATPVPVPAQVPPTNPVAVENDRICKSMYALPCNALIHMLGPMNAELRKETRACVRETVSVYVSGKWVADNKYQDPKTGERYGDHCIAVSL